MELEESGETEALDLRPSASFEDQYGAAMDGTVVLDRSHLARVEASGNERESFLHNMLSADIKGLGSSAGTAATFLTPKGKLVADLVVLRESERFLMEMEASRVGPLLASLSRYIISEDVTLRSLAKEEIAFSLEGEGAGALASKLTGISQEELQALRHLDTRQADGARLTVRRHERSPRIDVAGTPSRARALVERAIDAGATIGGEELAETRRIEAGRPRFGIDMDESHMPMEAGLDEAVNFEKGCYVGQEYVVRLAHRGHLNRKLVRITLQCDDPPPKGASIEVKGDTVGEITSAAYSPGFGSVVALGYLKRGYFEPDTSVAVMGKDGRVSSPLHSA